MKHRLAHIILMLLVACQAMSQTTVTGIVTDGHNGKSETGLAGANVFIIGTIDGCLTDSLGRFSFQTDQTGSLTLRVTFIGYDDYTLTTSQPTDLHITMHERATTIDEVVVTASTYSFGKVWRHRGSTTNLARHAEGWRERQAVCPWWRERRMPDVR